MFFKGLTGKIVTPKNPEYNELRQEWNRAIQKFPIAIVYCYHKKDVSNAILWCQHHCISFRIRNGGHNYEGYSTGNGLIVIDLSHMNRLSFHDNLLKVEGGVKNRQLYDYISSKGYPFPGGTCPTVGVSGYALGGGWGLSCRHLGLGCDSLVEIEMIDYKGQILVANKKVNSDLFWACRGAGGNNFGIVVSMTFKVPPKVNKVTYIEIYYPNTSQRKQERFLSAWQDWITKADERMTLQASIYHSPEEGYAVFSRGIFYGTPKEAIQILKPFLDLRDYDLNLEYLTFLKAIQKIESSYPNSEKFKSTGRFVAQLLCPKQISQVVDFLNEIPEGSVFTGLSLYALGGKVSEVGSRDTAFYFRNAKYILLIQSVWENSEFAKENVAWVNKNFSYLESITEGSYVNFPYNRLEDYLESYYGANSSRLRMVKRKYDPCNVFRFQQSIR